MNEIFEDKIFQNTLLQLGGTLGMSLDDVRDQAEIYLKELYTTQNPIVNGLAVEAVQYFISRGYDKTIDVNPQEMQQLVKIMYKHPVAFVMTHKTYIDMMVLGIALVRHGLPLPHIFAGINMNFFGIGQLGKQTGVIFIRRSFKENEIYKATLRHYLAHLVKDKKHFMWAIEGTRSRTGKLLWPKMGILKYIMEASNHAKAAVKYIPVSIVYDLIPDVKDMTEEGQNKAKTPESFKWGVEYFKKMNNDFGKISLRLGLPVDAAESHNILSSSLIYGHDVHGNVLSRFALDLVYRINEVTPVTTASLICISLLGKYSLKRKAIENDVHGLMTIIESQKPDAMVDRGKPIGETVQSALSLLTKASLVQILDDGIDTKYIINPSNYLSANYYGNMAVHHLYHRAFIEMAIIRLQIEGGEQRLLAFWHYIMELRDLFKFEFFYSEKAEFTDEIEKHLELMDPNWEEYLLDKSYPLENLITERGIVVAPVVLHTYIEAYRVVIKGLIQWDDRRPLSDESFIVHCMHLGGEMQWQGKIQRLESISKPFLVNGIRLIRNQGLISEDGKINKVSLKKLLSQVDYQASIVHKLQDITSDIDSKGIVLAPINRAIVPGSKTESVTLDILAGESGPHIGAYFDLDRTLIKGFSAKEFFQSRLLSGKMSTKEIIAQFSGILVYTTGNGNFAGLAAISAKGVKGINEKVFKDVGEEVYLNNLSEEIYPESRALVAAHMSMGHTIAIISAATPYQVNPIARELGIENILCTKMEVENGKFTGNIIEPACWGEGKAHAGRKMAEEFNLDMQKTYFYTDSAEDLPLLEIVGKPRPLNPDSELSAIAYENDWPISRFDDTKRVGMTEYLRTGLAMGSFIPAILKGFTSGAKTMSWQDGINTMIATIGDVGLAAAGINLAIKGKVYLNSSRPAVFIFNHQSSADVPILCKLLRKDITGVAKKELEKVPILGQILQAGGAIFLDRKNKEKAIKALEPAVEILQNGTSIVIAPEGTRSYDYQLGKFKKGAFHIAIQAGVPIIPIVIKNAHDAMPRGSNIFRPGTINVTVLKPIPTEDWELVDLDNHIHSIRSMFLRELGQEEVIEEVK